MKTILPLNEKQLISLPQETDKKYRPFRILANGQSVNICTGQLSSRHSNIMYHTIYWDRPKKFRDMVLKYMKENNPGIKFRITLH